MSVYENQLLRDYYNDNRQVWISPVENVSFDNADEQDLKALEGSNGFQRYAAYIAYVDAVKQFRSTLNWWQKIYFKIFPIKVRLG